MSLLLGNNKYILAKKIIAIVYLLRTISNYEDNNRSKVWVMMVTVSLVVEHNVGPPDLV